MSQNEDLDMTDAGRQLALMKALSNPARLELLKYLHNGPSCVTVASIKLKMSQPNLSKHLQILKDAGIIDSRGRGAEHCYFICRPTLIGPLLDELFQKGHVYRPCSKPEQKE